MEKYRVVINGEWYVSTVAMELSEEGLRTLQELASRTAHLMEQNVEVIPYIENDPKYEGHTFTNL